MEYWPSSGQPSLAACLKKVDEADVVVVIVAHRYGWVPDDPRNSEGKSITWLECERGWAAGKKVLGFLVDEKYAWPLELKENYQLVEQDHLPDEEFTALRNQVKHNEKRLAEFKKELNKNFRSKFSDVGSFRALVSEALAEWWREHRGHEPQHAGDPDAYLRALEEDTRQIRITGLTTKKAEPYSFGIDEIYIPLVTVAGHDGARSGEARGMEQQRRMALEEALSQRKVVIVGDPGSGKSTFLRRVAFELCRNLRGTRPAGPRRSCLGTTGGFRS
jgi:hypothetical protein